MEMRTPGVYCEVCGACILIANPADNTVAAEAVQSAIDAHKGSAGHDPEPLFMPDGTLIRYTTH